MSRPTRSGPGVVEPARGTRWSNLPPVLIVAGMVAFIPGGLFPFVWLKIALLGAAILLHFVAPVRRGRLRRMDTILITAGILWLVLAALMSAAPWPSLVGRWPRYEGLPVITAYAASALIGAHVLRPSGDNRTAWRSYLQAAAVASLAIGAVAILETAGFRPLGGPTDVRPGSTLGNATDLGLAAALLCGALLPQALVTRSRLLAAGAATAALTVGLSGSRAALLGLLVTVGVLAAAAIVGRAHGASRGSGVGRGTWVAVGSVITVATVAALAVPAVRDRLASTSTITGRFSLWASSAELALDRPVLGVGPSGFVDALPPHLSREAAIQLGSQTVHDSPHMWALQAAAAGGLVMTAIAVALAGRVLWAGTRMIRSRAASPQLVGAFAAVVGYGVALLTHFTSPGTTPLAAMLAGAVLATNVPPPERISPETTVTCGARALAAVSAAGLTVAALSAAVSEWPLKSGTDELAAGRTDAANSSFERAAALRPWDSDVALLSAQAMATAVSSGVEDAPGLTVTWAQRSLAHNPNSVEAGIALAVGQLTTGDLDAAVATLDEIADRAPHTFLLHVQRGIARFGQADVEGAIADLEEAAELDPRSPLPWTVLARIHERLGDADAAAAAWQEAAVREG